MFCFVYNLVCKTQYLKQLPCFTIGPIRKPLLHGFQSSTVPTASNSSTLKTTSLMSKAKLGSTATLASTTTLGSRKVYACLSVVHLLIGTKHLTHYHCVIIKCISVSHTVKLGTSCTRLWEAPIPPLPSVFRYFKDSFSAAFL